MSANIAPGEGWSFGMELSEEATELVIIFTQESGLKVVNGGYRAPLVHLVLIRATDQGQEGNGILGLLAFRK